MKLLRASLFCVVLIAIFLSANYSTFAERSADSSKVYTFKWTQTIVKPKWLYWIMPDTTYSVDWEGSYSDPMCHGDANGCFGELTIVITTCPISKNPEGQPIDPGQFNPDSSIILGDEYLRGVDTNSRLAYIRFPNNTQGLNGDYFIITNRSILPKDENEEPNNMAFSRHITSPAFFPNQRAKYSPILNAYVAYFYFLPVSGN